MKYFLFAAIYIFTAFIGRYVYVMHSETWGLVIGGIDGIWILYVLFLFFDAHLNDPAKKPISTYRTINIYDDDRRAFWHSIRWVHADAWGYKMSYSYDRYTKGDKQRALNEIYATINTKYYEQIQQKDGGGAGE